MQWTNEFALAVPSDWVPIDMSPNLVDAMVAKLKNVAPQLVDAFEAMAASDAIKFVAFDPTTALSGYASNITVSEELRLISDPSKYVDALNKAIASIGGKVDSSEGVKVGDLDGLNLRISLTVSLASGKSIQVEEQALVVDQGPNRYTVSLAYASGSAKDFDQIFAEVCRSFRFIAPNAIPMSPTPRTPSTATAVPIAPPHLNKIAFESNRGIDSNYGVFLMNLDGSKQTEITQNLADDREPSWSPDGKKIVFISNRGANSDVFDIYTMNVDGSSQTALTEKAGNNYAPRYSPDGSQIVFSSTRDGNFKVYVMNADGTNVRKLTNLSSLDAYADWSPDGTRLVFHSLRDGNNYQIYVMNADGSSVKRITNDATDDSEPAWSPDGKRIAYTCKQDKEFQIYVMNADGTNAVNISNSTSSDWGPRWSPDGTKIYFTSDRDGVDSADVYVMDASGTNQTNLTKNPAWDSSGAPSP